MYFSFFKLKKWGKKTAAARRHICAVLPYNNVIIAPQDHNNFVNGGCILMGDCI